MCTFAAQNSSVMYKFRFVDLLCGIGGFHQAMTSLGGECVFACDIDESCRDTYFMNYGIMPKGDIAKVASSEIPSHDVLCAGFPCQSFSKAGNRQGFKDSIKGTPFLDILRILAFHQPKYALLENVRNLATHDNGYTWKTIYDSLTHFGYNLLPDPIIFSPHYIGIPQHRERVFIMCVRKDVGEIPPFFFNAKEMPLCNIRGVMQSDGEISNIERYKLSKEQIQLLDIWDEFIRNIDCIRLPGFPVWTEWLCDVDLKTINDTVPKWKRNIIYKNVDLYLSNRRFINQWLARARQCPMFFGAKAKLEWQVGQVDHPSIWDNIIQIRPSGIRVKPCTYFPALVAITQTPIVGKEKRFLTLRECARIQSFPETFIPCSNEKQAYKQFGNAVNVDLVRLFAKYMFGDTETRQKYHAK